ncbi:uncharacterized protein PRCAT00000508001 [Priceomyces carsonii]|uniref:uncharacterized protein n=1 Tax=Priceomyces carsonii TaxID=28549 RepID=UPI002EDB1CB1|nr:unnamed protein product [Priceomyces carsonii]
MSTLTQNPLKVIDIEEDDESTAVDLLEAGKMQGFLMIEGHGFTQTEVDQLFGVSEHFFKLPVEYKNIYAMNNSNHGYAYYGIENLDPASQKTGDPKEALNISHLNFATGESSSRIPSWFLEDQGRLHLVQDTIKRLYELSIKILKILALGLRIEDSDNVKGAEWFNSKYVPDKESGSTFRLLHYPGQQKLNPESVIRAGAHTDYGSMTLLFQRENQEGLEIYSPITKNWEPVPFVPASPKYSGQAPPLIVNIGDLLSYWTSGLLKSTVHRVKFPAKVQESGQDRYSIVFFSHPNDDTLLLPVPSTMIREIKGRGANSEETYITAKQHLDKRLAATYGRSY